ncbi:hypothetical protein ACOSP7_007736 [Xanthoceras sorbifolium]
MEHSLSSAIGGGTCSGAEAVGDRVLAIETLGYLPSIEHELLETIVGGASGVTQGLVGGHPAGKAGEVAATEGLDDGRLAAEEGRMERGCQVQSLPFSPVRGVVHGFCGSMNHGPSTHLTMDIKTNAANAILDSF